MPASRSPASKPTVVFLCTGNCIRSQMAEGLLRSLAPDRYEAASGGAFPAGYVHEHAIEVMAEIGIDISTQESKSILVFFSPPDPYPDVLVSLCSYAASYCPNVPACTRQLDWPVWDPIEAEGTPDERRAQFRRVRDQIRERIKSALAKGELDGA